MDRIPTWLGVCVLFVLSIPSLLSDVFRKRPEAKLPKTKPEKSKLRKVWDEDDVEQFKKTGDLP